MNSLVIWDKQTGEILACMQKPTGTATEPSIKKTFAHRPDLWDRLESAWIGQRLTTLEARGQLEIVDDKPQPKR